MACPDMLCVVGELGQWIHEETPAPPATRGDFRSPAKRKSETRTIRKSEKRKRFLESEKLLRYSSPTTIGISPGRKTRGRPQAGMALRG